jgi:hypothetical protein
MGRYFCALGSGFLMTSQNWELSSFQKKNDASVPTISSFSKKNDDE